MEVVLSLICQHCKTLLMQQKMGVLVGDYATINIDELSKFAGQCCSKPDRTVKVEVKPIIVDSTSIERQRIATLKEEGWLEQ